jgi:hypothetical protein
MADSQIAASTDLGPAKALVVRTAIARNTVSRLGSLAGRELVTFSKNVAQHSAYRRSGSQSQQLSDICIVDMQNRADKSRDNPASQRALPFILASPPLPGGTQLRYALTAT